MTDLSGLFITHDLSNHKCRIQVHNLVCRELEFELTFLLELYLQLCSIMLVTLLFYITTLLFFTGIVFYLPLFYRTFSKL